MNIEKTIPNKVNKLAVWPRFKQKDKQQNEREKIGADSLIKNHIGKKQSERKKRARQLKWAIWMHEFDQKWSPFIYIYLFSCVRLYDTDFCSNSEWWWLFGAVVVNSYYVA